MKSGWKIKLSAAFAVGVFFTMGALPVLEASGLQAGAAQQPMDLSAALPKDGFSVVHDALYARTLLFDNGKQRLAIVSIDMTSIGNTDELKNLVSQAAGVAPENIWICAAHSFSSLHYWSGTMPVKPKEPVKNTAFGAALKQAVTSSAQGALADLQAAKVGYGSGTVNVNINRDMQTADGWWHGSDERGTSDKELSVLRVMASNGKPLAVLMNYAVQSSVLDGSVQADGKQAISADLGGAATAYLSERLPGAVAFFAVGAAGDQAPLFQANRYVLDENGKSARIDIHDAGYDLLALQSERLGMEALRVEEGIQAKDSDVLRLVKGSVSCETQAMNHNTQGIQPVKSYDYKETGKEDVPIEIMQIGDGVLVGVQPELAAKIGQEIKAKSPYKHTMVLTMVNGAAKYMADQDSYDKYTYEAINSKYAKGSAEKVEAKALTMLKEMKQKDA